jgi:hypothetical protein
MQSSADVRNQTLCQTLYFAHFRLFRSEKACSICLRPQISGTICARSIPGQRKNRAIGWDSNKILLWCHRDLRPATCEQSLNQSIRHSVMNLRLQNESQALTNGDRDFRKQQKDLIMPNPGHGQLWRRTSRFDQMDCTIEIEIRRNIRIPLMLPRLL